MLTSNRSVPIWRLVLVLGLALPRAVSAQPLLERVSSTLTGAATPLTPDERAAVQATGTTFNDLLLSETGIFPLEGSAAGFTYRLNERLGVVERAAGDFGPFFTERTMRNGARQLSAGVTVQVAEFGSLQGFSLASGDFPALIVRSQTTGAEETAETLKLTVRRRTVAPFVAYGVTDRLSLGASVPFVAITLDGERLRQAGDGFVRQAQQSGRAEGLGDVIVQSRYRLAGSAQRALSLGADLRLPTGNREQLLGAGSGSARILAIASLEEEHFGMHVNGGFTAGPDTREAVINTAVTVSAGLRVTLVAESVVRLVSSLPRLEQSYVPSATNPGSEVMRWVTAEKGQALSFGVVGAKWNVADQFLVSANLLIRLIDTGLRDRVTPSISLDYAF